MMGPIIIIIIIITYYTCFYIVSDVEIDEEILDEMEESDHSAPESPSAKLTPLRERFQVNSLSILFFNSTLSMFYQLFFFY